MRQFKKINENRGEKAILSAVYYIELEKKNKMNNISTRYLELKKKLFSLRYKFLNPDQRDSVFHTEGPLLVLAGAGSGKTTVLVNRIAFIIKYGNAYHNDFVPPYIGEREIETLENIAESAENLPDAELPELDGVLEQFIYSPVPAWTVLAITFTNKAAGEMKERLAKILGDSAAAEIWAGTFHSVCVRILRRHSDLLPYSGAFTIYDTDDTKKIVADIIKELNIGDNLLTPKQALTAISRYKDKLLYPEDITPRQGDLRESNLYRVYKKYQERLTLSNALDFDDIILRTVRLLSENPDVRDYYNNKFNYISVDEYQDTNVAQYKLISLLGGKNRNIMAVGDDDQSIYKFRGATIENILNFTKSFENAAVIKLEQNYRSTKNILDAANGIICHNSSRMGKSLWTDKESDVPVVVKETVNQTDEANFILEKINSIIETENREYKDFAVLYRLNAQAGSLELAFSKNKLPYRVLGTTKFFDRKEIKDMRAYLSVVQNPADSVSLKRIINEPKRKIGDTTISVIERISVAEQMGMFDVIQNSENYTALSRSVSKLKPFAELINSFIAIKDSEPLPDLIEKIYDNSGYRSMLELSGTDGHDRLENVKEFISQAMAFSDENENPSLADFLEKISLTADIDGYDSSHGAVTLMTVHSAKGLEFPVVFIPGMEEEIFPSALAKNDDEQIEEERRLAYVAVTRAKEALFISYTKERYIYNKTTNHPLSRFIAEIPPATMKHIRLTEIEQRRYTSFFSPRKSAPKIPPNSEFTASYKTAESIKTDSADYVQLFNVGDSIEHSVYGDGLVISVTDLVGDTMYEVAFDEVGTKKLMGTYLQNKMRLKDSL